VASASVGDKSLLTLEARGPGLFSSRASRSMADAIGMRGADLVFDKRGDGTLFYDVKLRYAPLRLPTTARDEGFFVKKVMRAVKPGQIGASLARVPESGVTHFSAGDIVLVDLVVVAPSPSKFVAIDDPLPAGLEAIDKNLSTTASWFDVGSSGGEEGGVNCPGCSQEQDDALAKGGAYLDVWHHQELRDDRALFFVDDMPAGMFHFRYLARATAIGRFVVPPTKAEAMYEPDVFGRTAADVVEVR
jgi:hypothetical protein